MHHKLATALALADTPLDAAGGEVDDGEDAVRTVLCTLAPDGEAAMEDSVVIAPTTVDDMVAFVEDISILSVGLVLVPVTEE
ncbi:hypothetical protein LTR95_018936, partial [Oleoguttula sp. CCFEE 5521]